MSKYEIQTFCLCGGWQNTWQVTEANGQTKPETFNTHAEAMSALQEFLQDIDDEIASGNREADEGYSLEEFRIIKIKPQASGV